jgi:hypothetical protein
MSSQPQRVEVPQDPGADPNQGLERRLSAVAAQSAALIGPAAGSVAGLVFIAGIEEEAGPARPQRRPPGNPGSAVAGDA